MVDPNTVFKPVELESDPKTAAQPQVKAILVVDNNVKEAAQIRNCLDACGYDLSVWADPADGRERFRSRPFNLVVLSTNLGDQGMNVLLDELRPKRVPPKVLLIADEDEGDAAARCFLRFVAVVNRPLNLEEMAGIVEHLIGPPVNLAQLQQAQGRPPGSTTKLQIPRARPGGPGAR